MQVAEFEAGGKFEAKKEITAQQVMAQLSEIQKQGANEIKVTCICEKRLPLFMAFRCLYCGIFMCQKCAESHFGKTRMEYNRERREAQAGRE